MGWFDDNGFDGDDIPMDAGRGYNDFRAPGHDQVVQAAANPFGGEQEAITQAQLKAFRDQARAQGLRVADDDVTAYKQMQGGLESLRGSASAAPSPYQKFGQTLSAPEMPADLMDKWDRTFDFKYDPNEDPGTKLRMSEALNALETSAAARGKLFTPGTQQALVEKAAAIAGDNYDSAFNRALTKYQTDYNTFGGDRTRRAALVDQQYGRVADAFRTNYNVHSADELNAFNTGRTIDRDNRADFESDRAFDYGKTRNDQDDLFRFAEIGYGAASGGAGLAERNSARVGDLLTSQGNALAAGRIGANNAMTTGWSGVANAAADALSRYGYRRPGGASS